MSPAQAVRGLEAAADGRSARAAVRGLNGASGFSRAYFQRILKLLGSDVAAAAKLASRWRIALEVGDDPALAYRARGVHERQRGRWPESAEAFRQAGSLARDPVERLSFQAGAVDGLGRAGDAFGAKRLGQSLAKGLDRLGRRDLAARVRLNVGNALVWSDRYVDARRWYRSALAGLDSSEFAAESAAAKLGLSTAELFGGSLDDAERWAAEALREFEALGQSHYALLAQVNQAHAASLGGRPDEAWDRFLALREALAHDKVERRRVEEFLGDAYLKLNMVAEAVDCFRNALSMHPSRPPNLNRANCLYGLGSSFAAASEMAKARRAFEAAQATYARVGNEAWAASTQASLSSVYRRLGKRREALANASDAAAALARLRSPYLLAESLLELAEAELANGRSPEQSLSRAGAIVSHMGYGLLEWKVAYLRAKSPPEKLALRRYRRMAAAIFESRMRIRSSTAGLHFLRDKQAALLEYLERLLARPTRSHIHEAFETVRRSRSAALIDEILSARALDLDADSAAQLDALRKELASNSHEPSTGGERRRIGSNKEVSSLQRRWVELTRRIITSIEPTNRALGPTDATVVVEGSKRYFALRFDRSQSISVSPKELSKRLRWLVFELLAPQADPNADPSDALRESQRLASDFAPLWESKGGVLAICPDGFLWRMPWQVLAQSLGENRETVLLPGASFCSASVEESVQPRRTAVWYAAEPGLPNVEREAETFLERFPNSDVCRTAAEAREAMRGSDWDLLHVAGHASFHEANPMFSYLSFRDGPVYADEIARAGFRVGHVVLSACDTACVSVLNRSEPDGLARSFLARSARSVLAAQWPLDDEAARSIMCTYYSELAAGRSIVASLAQARRVCRESHPHPYFWGAFVLLGGYVS